MIGMLGAGFGTWPSNTEADRLVAKLRSEQGTAYCAWANQQRAQEMQEPVSQITTKWGQAEDAEFITVENR